MAKIRERGNSFQADIITPEGQRLRKSFGTLKEAETFIRLSESASYDTQGQVSSTLGPFIEDVFDRLWGDTKRPDAPRINCDVLISRYVPATTPISSINTRYIEGIITRMKSEGMANGTINRKLSTLSKLLRYALRLDIIIKMPIIDTLPEGRGRDRVMSPEEEEQSLQFFEHIGLPSTAALLRFLLYTGCRTGEAWKLERDDVGKDHIHFRDTKNGLDRVIPITPKAREGWEVIKRSSNHDRPFMAIPKDTFRGHWMRLKKHLAAEDDKCFVPHMLRHTCATRLVKAGIDLPRVMKWMGHKNIQTTMRYAHLAPKDLDMAAAALANGDF